MTMIAGPAAHKLSVRSRHVAVALATSIALLAVLAHLRDPPWLLNVTSGLSAWETDDLGVRYRWTSGHASFFVPADARYVVLTMRSVKVDPADRPITATVTIDDKPAHLFTFSTEEWHAVRLNLPPRGKRDARRIDIKLNRLRAHQRGLQLQSPEVARPDARP